MFPLSPNIIPLKFGADGASSVYIIKNYHYVITGSYLISFSMFPEFKHSLLVFIYLDFLANITTSSSISCNPLSTLFQKGLEFRTLNARSLWRSPFCLPSSLPGNSLYYYPRSQALCPVCHSHFLLTWFAPLLGGVHPPVVSSVTKTVHIWSL